MSEQAETLAKVKDLEIFKEFSENELESLLDLADALSFVEGETVVKQDDPGECMYLIVQGKVKVIHESGERRVELAELGKGDFFGEIALVDEGLRSADVVAMGPVEMLSISQGTIRALAGVYPSASFKLLVAVGRVLVARLRQGNKKYIDSLLP